MTSDEIRELFAAIDSQDPDRFASFLTEDVRFRWGSQPPITGRREVRDHVQAFFSGFQALSHRILEFWEAPDRRVLFVQGEVSYTLASGQVVSLPFLNLFRVHGRAISEYLIYADPTPLTAAMGGA
jgi:ketosteroid isomerase-like protein